MAIQESGEMYLETILILSEKQDKVRSIDVSEYMGYSKPSVSRAVGVLKSEGYLDVGRDGSLKLTEHGKKTAESIYERHKTLTKFLVELGIDEKTASEDACKIEHIISEKTFDVIKKKVMQ